VLYKLLIYLLTDAHLTVKSSNVCYVI